MIYSSLNLDRFIIRPSLGRTLLTPGGDSEARVTLAKKIGGADGGAEPKTSQSSAEKSRARPASPRQQSGGAVAGTAEKGAQKFRIDINILLGMVDSAPGHH